MITSVIRAQSSLTLLATTILFLSDNFFLLLFFFGFLVLPYRDRFLAVDIDTVAGVIDATPDDIDGSAGAGRSTVAVDPTIRSTMAGHSSDSRIDVNGVGIGNNCTGPTNKVTMNGNQPDVNECRRRCNFISAGFELGFGAITADYTQTIICDLLHFYFLCATL